jgi:hypothetical protein
MQQFSGDGTGKKFPWVYGVLKKLGALARAMGYLVGRFPAAFKQTDCISPNL